MASEREIPLRWVDAKSFPLFLLLFGAFVVAFFPVWRQLVLTWYNSEQYSHGFLMIPLCLYILWLNRARLAETPVRPSPWGLVLASLSLLLYVFAHLAEIITVAAFSMVCFVAAVVIYFLGFAMLRELLFPFFLLLFMIPVPSQIYASLTIPLQLFVSKVSAGLASASGLPIFREGNVLHLPDRTLEVVEACSGLRSMIALLALSAIYGYFTLRSNWLKGVLFFSGIPVAIVVNILRVLLIVFALHHLDLDLTSENTHTLFGVAVFVMALFLIALTRGVISIWDRSPSERS